MALSDLAYPSRCSVCSTVGPSPCAVCVDRLRPMTEIGVGPPVDRCLVLLEYDDLTRRLIARLKYGSVRTSVEWFAEAMAARVVHCGEGVDLVTWVPAAAANRRRRGFDQGELLARPIAGRLGCPAAALLRRRGPGSQTGLGRSERRHGPELVARSDRRISGSRVLVVDDVVTTGSTLRRAGEALIGAGAGKVMAVVAAHPRA